MQALFALMLTVLALPALANGQKTADQHASVFIFMDTNYGAVVSRYNLKVAGVEMPPMHGYKYVGLSLPPGQHLIGLIAIADHAAIPNSKILEAGIQFAIEEGFFVMQVARHLCNAGLGVKNDAVHSSLLLVYQRD